MGIAILLDKLAALGLCLVAEPVPGRRTRVRRVSGGIALVFVTLLPGGFHVGATLAQHAGHDHTAGARGRAGVLMPVRSDPVPIPEQVRAAADLAAATRAQRVHHAAAVRLVGGRRVRRLPPRSPSKPRSRW